MTKHIWLVCSFCTLVIGGMLFWQYRFFNEQVQALQEAKSKYEEHIAVLKQVIADTLINGEPLSVPDKQKEQLRQALLTYLKQKDTSIDVEDLEELYRSFSKSITVNKQKSVRKRKQPAVRQRQPHFLAWPLDKDKFWMSSFFGRRKMDNGKWSFHFGIDLAALTGTPIKAAANGKVIEVSSGNGYGKTILILHDKNYRTRYAHLDRIKVHQGQLVKRGQIIGTVGATGNVRGNGTDASHLHFEVHQNGRQVNPIYYLT